VSRIAELLADGLTAEEIVALRDVHEPRLHLHIEGPSFRSLFELRLIEIETGGAGVRLTRLGREVMGRLGQKPDLCDVA